MSDKKKIIKKKPEHPNYEAFTMQISATLLLARKIRQDCQNQTPRLAQKFLEMFDKKAV